MTLITMFPRGADDEERKVHHHVGAAERVPQCLGVADVPAAVIHLRPAVGGRVERAPCDAHHPRHPVIGLERRNQAGPEGSGRAGHRDRQIPLAARHAPTLPDAEDGRERGSSAPGPACGSEPNVLAGRDD